MEHEVRDSSTRMSLRAGRYWSKSSGLGPPVRAVVDTTVVAYFLLGMES
jgi:hypothetical protein